MNAEIIAKVERWRSEAAAGTLSLEEMKEAIAFLRGDRKAAAASTDAVKRSKAVKMIPTAADLLNELKGGV